jgi:tetratricopeptide (TPR) repeat protein
VYYRLAKVALGIAAVAALPSGSSCAQNNPAPQAAQESPYKDQGEYDLAVAAQKEADPAKQLDRIKEWEQKYPDSKLKGNRTFLQANALMKIASAAYGKQGPAELLDAGQKAAQQVLDNFDTYFSDDIKKSIGATDDQWKQAKASVTLQAHSILGWIDLQKKDYPKAEAEFKTLLGINPNDAQSAYSLGSAIIAQKNVARYSEALYEIAHALSIVGPTALSGAGQQTAEQYLTRVYAGYHGDDVKDPKAAQQVKDDIAKLKQTASAAALPPADFHIKNANEIAQEQFKNQEEFDKAHPDIALWRTIKATLTSPTGDTYFEQVKGTVIPPPEIGTLKAKIVTVNEKDIVANVDNAGGDVTLKFEKAVNQKVLNPGDAFEFKGEVASYTKDPYMITLTIDDPKESIKGLPDNAFSAAPVRKPPVKKKTTK